MVLIGAQFGKSATVFDSRLWAINGHSSSRNRTTALPKKADGREIQFLSDLSQ